MKAVRTLLFVLLSLAVAAPVAASPTVPAAAWPGVSDVLLNVAGPAPEAAWPGVPVAAWPGLKHSHFVGMGTPSKTAAWGCSDFNLQRLVAEWREFDNNEVFTDQGVPGISLYTKTVTVPDGCDTLYVTFDATGDEEVETWFSCKVDGNFCNPGPTSRTDTPGWISLQHNPVPFVFQEDNNIHYTWCTPITGGQDHFVEIRMAAGEDGTSSYLEGEHFFIDASYTGGGCVQAAPAEDPPLLPHLSTPKLPGVQTPALPTLPKLP